MINRSKKGQSGRTGDKTPILVVIKGLALGGAERMLAEASRYWDRSEFDYRVAYFLPERDELVGDLEEADIPVMCLGGRGGWLGITYRLFRLVRALEPDLVHAHLPSAGVLVRLCSNVPVVYTEHNITSSYHRFTRFANRATYRRNQATIAVSEAVASSISGYRGPPIQVIPNAVTVDPAHLDPERARRELGLSSRQPMVVHVGNIKPHKGHRILLRAAATLAAKRPEVTVVSIGAESHPGEMQALEVMLRELGLEERVRLLGRRRDALDFVSAADVFVNPAEAEGLPVAVLEAMALQRPVVATSVGGVPEVIEHERTGLLVAPGDPHALSSAIERVLEAPELAARLGAEGGRIVAERYSLPSMVGKVEDLYRSLLRQETGDRTEPRSL